jgi:hypothetical protein
VRIVGNDVKMIRRLVPNQVPPLRIEGPEDVEILPLVGRQGSILGS